MAQSLAMRATSLAASAALLALAGIAALTVSWTVARLTPTPQGLVIISEPEPTMPPPTAPIVPRTHPAEPTRPTDQATGAATTVQVSTNASDTGPAIPDPGPPTISNPHWLQTPHDLARYYPVIALRREIEGAVQLDCLVTTTGALQCTVISEAPANWGFGAAAIRISQDYRMVPATQGGAPVEGRYRMRVPFRLNR
ncbi:MAG: TonB family protein [Vitreimonas sp.]